MFLDLIENAGDIKNIKPADLDALAAEIRAFLLEKVGRTGGHLASNLGIVELSMALHISLDLEKDKIIWDVGHQSYVHKILTGRKDQFDRLRKYGGLSGFPKHRESKYDCFNTGHSSTSIAAALGFARAFEQSGNDAYVVCVIGDGALTGGLAFEALNNAAKIDRNFIIILNDNEMSISENVGGLSSYLNRIRTGKKYINLKARIKQIIAKLPHGERAVAHIKSTKNSIKQLFIPGMFFEDMGITYLGPVDGHDTNKLIKVIEEAKHVDHAVLIHVKTIKGKGYKFAEENPSKFHGINPFNPITGDLIAPKTKDTYTDVFSRSLIKEADINKKIVAICAAMPDGTGLRAFADKFPDRFFDVGIAEGEAVTFAAGLAAGGMKPFVAIYSTFLQRGFDQVLHDVCIQNLPVVFCVDRAGLVGGDGETHQGIFDISYLSMIPNMNIFAPKNDKELEAAISFAADFNAPLAIRYPRGEAFSGLSEYNEPIVFGKSEIICSGKDIAILALGTMVKTGFEVKERLIKRGFSPSLINARFAKPIDEELIDNLLMNHKTLITMEENVINGGLGMAVLRYINNINADARVITIAIPNGFIEQGSIEEQYRECGLDIDAIIRRIESEI